MKHLNRDAQHDRHRRCSTPGFVMRGGFTMIEVLVVIGLIGILATLLLVALAATTTHAGVAKTQALMTSMAQATSQFKSDHGYLPPVLDPTRAMSIAPPANIGELQDWVSFTSPAEYLLGYGSALEDGNDGLGFRSPGNDGVWGALSDPSGNGWAELSERTPNQAGKVYPPYLELDDEELLAKVSGLDPDGHPILVGPNDAGYSTLNAPMTILDHFGEPIHYYQRHPYAHRNDLPADQRFNLGDVFLLRPFTVKAGSDTESLWPDATGDASTTTELKAASFAYFSSGPDLTDNHELRFDDPNDSNNSLGTEFANEDNIVEVGN